MTILRLFYVTSQMHDPHDAKVIAYLNQVELGVRSQLVAIKRDPMSYTLQNSFPLFDRQQKIQMKKPKLCVWESMGKCWRTAYRLWPQPWRYPKKWSRILCGQTIGRRIPSHRVVEFVDKCSATPTTWTSRSCFTGRAARDRAARRARPCTMWLTFGGTTAAVVGLRCATSARWTGKPYLSMVGIRTCAFVIIVGARRTHEPALLPHSIRFDCIPFF